MELGQARLERNGPAQQNDSLVQLPLPRQKQAEKMGWLGVGRVEERGLAIGFSRLIQPTGPLVFEASAEQCWGRDCGLRKYGSLHDRLALPGPRSAPMARLFPCRRPPFDQRLRSERPLQFRAGLGHVARVGGFPVGNRRKVRPNPFKARVGVKPQNDHFIFTFSHQVVSVAGDHIGHLLTVMLARSAVFHIAIGNNLAREKEAGWWGHERLASVVHPAALVSRFGNVACGCFVAAGAVIGPTATVGPGVIVNHGAIVDHDVDVGAFSHIAPNVTLGGHVKIGRRVLMGAGATVLPSMVVGDDVTVGAGSVVNEHLMAPGVYAGIPARRVQ